MADLADLTGADIDALIATLPPAARDKVVDCDEPAVKARQLAAVGCTTVTLRDDDGFVLIGPRASDPAAYRELRDLEAAEQVEREAKSSWRRQTDGHGAAMRRLVDGRRHELAGPGRLERARRAAVRSLSRLRPRRREHRATRRVRRSRRTSSSSSDPPGEPEPPSSDRRRR